MPKKPAAAHSKQKKKPTRPAAQPRMLSVPKRIWYNPLTWRRRQPVPVRAPLPKARILFMTILRQLWANKRLFGGIILIYGLLNLLLVRGLSGSSDLTELKSTLDQLLHGLGGHLTTAFTTFAFLIASSGNGNTTASGMYQVILLLICSLAFIWALRQALAHHVVRVRDSFYQGMYPLVPVLLLLGLIAVQLVPMSVGGTLYSIVVSNGIVQGWWQKALCFTGFLLLSLWTLRMITASMFALYVTTLPDMTPLRAYRSALQLVYGRRLLIWRKLIFLPVALLLIAVIIELPLILFVTPVAVWAFFILSTLALPVVHGYLYNLYRAML